MMSLDFTQHSVVVKCDDCPFWYAFAFTRIEGWRSAANHEANVHPELNQARQALDKAEKATRRIRF